MSVITASRTGITRFPLRGPALAGCVILGVLILLAILAPWIAPHDPEAVDAKRILASPSLTHPFGSDALGRDVFSRTMYALRVSLIVAISSVLLAAVIAVPLGALAGYFGGWVDTLISRPLDMLLVLPALLLAISLISVIGPGSAVAALAIAIIYLPILARVMRVSSLSTSRLGYVEGAELAGFAPPQGHCRTRGAQLDQPGHRAGDDSRRLRPADRGGPETSSGSARSRPLPRSV